MKRIVLPLLALLAFGFLSGCAGDDPHYTRSQVAAQRGTHDPLARTYSRTY